MSSNPTTDMTELKLIGLWLSLLIDYFTYTVCAKKSTFLTILNSNFLDFSLCHSYFKQYFTWVHIFGCSTFLWVMIVHISPSSNRIHALSSRPNPSHTIHFSAFVSYKDAQSMSPSGSLSWSLVLQRSVAVFIIVILQEPDQWWRKYWLHTSHPQTAWVCASTWDFIIPWKIKYSRSQRMKVSLDCNDLISLVGQSESTVFWTVSVSLEVH